MIAKGFKPVAWVGAVGAAALGCYMLSLRVASERADVGSLERRIVATQQQIRSLETELGARGRLAQLEQWNDDVLALSAPASGQFIQGAQLASFETREPTPLEAEAELRMAAADAVPAASAPATPAPAQAATPAPQRAIAPAAPLQTATIQRTSLSLPAPAPRSAVPALAPRPIAVVARPAISANKRSAIPVRITPAAAPRVASTPGQIRTGAASARTAVPSPAARTRIAAADVTARPTATARRPGLLDARTLRDLGSAARAERLGRARD